MLIGSRYPSTSKFWLCDKFSLYCKINHEMGKLDLNSNFYFMVAMKFNSKVLGLVVRSLSWSEWVWLCRHNSVGWELWPRARCLAPRLLHLLQQHGGGAGVRRVGGAHPLRLLAGRGRDAPHPAARPHDGAPQRLSSLQGRDDNDDDNDDPATTRSSPRSAGGATSTTLWWGARPATCTAPWSRHSSMSQEVFSIQCSWFLIWFSIQLRTIFQVPVTSSLCSNHNRSPPLLSYSSTLTLW